MRRLKQYFILPLSFCLVFISCSKDEFTEEDVLKIETQTNLSIFVYEPLVLNYNLTKKPLDGATVSLSQDGKIISVVTNSFGYASFDNSKLGSVFIEVKKDGYVTAGKEIQIDPSLRQNHVSDEIGVVAIKGNNTNSITVRGNVRIQTDLTTEQTEVPVGAIVQVYDYYDYYGYTNNRAPLATGKIDANGSFSISVPFGLTTYTSPYYRYIFVKFQTLEYTQKLYVLKNSVATLVDAKTVFDPSLGATSVPSVAGNNVSTTSPSGFLNSYQYNQVGNVVTINANYGTGSSRVVE